MNFLAKVIEEKKAELLKKEATLPFDVLKEEAHERQNGSTPRSFTGIFKKSNGLAVIAEIKLKSPSEGILTEKSHIEIAQEYGKSEADAISVLTEPNYFNGSLGYLRDVRTILSQPILRKDFITDAYHVYEAALYEADAYLLIAAALSEEELVALITVGTELGLDALVEVHNEADLEKALSAGAKTIGINNRDLSTLKIDLATSARLIPLIPKGTYIVSESGIKTPEDVRYLTALGLHGILVGSSIIKSGLYIETIRILKHA